MRSLLLLIATFGFMLFASFSSPKEIGPAPGGKWISLHLLNYTNDSSLQIVSRQLPALAERGVNILFLEVDYSYEFQSHPELRMKKYITRDGAAAFGKACKDV